MEKNLLLVFSLFFFYSYVFAQKRLDIPTNQPFEHFSCGTKVTSETARYEYEVGKLPKGGYRAITYIPIKPHIIRTSTGTGGLTLAQLNEAIANVNALYAPAEMRFYICSSGINYINSDVFYDFDMSEEAALRASNDVTNAINIYFTNTVTSGSSGLNGYSAFPTTSNTSNLVVMQNFATTNTTTLAHELGHYFYLYHTHETFYGGELVNGTNCSTAGDKVCDTPADVLNTSTGATYYNTATCTYTGPTTVVDALGQTYNPDLTLLMSYYHPCRNRFSAGQYARMKSLGLPARFNGGNAYNLNCAAATFAAITPTLSLANNSGVATLGNAGVQISWSSVVGVTGYFIERSENGGSSYIFVGGADPTAISFIDKTASNNKTYTYKVTPSNTFNNAANTATISTPNLNYCIPIYTYSCSTTQPTISISNFTLTGANSSSINNNSSCNIYENFANQSISANLNGTYNFSVSAHLYNGSYYPQSVAIWLDSNRDGQFSGSSVGAGSEMLFQTPINNPNSSIISGTITIPSNALSGFSRLRVRTQIKSYGVVYNACDRYHYGETEDYAINILCPSVTASISSSNGLNLNCNTPSTVLTATGGNTYLWNTGSTNPSLTLSPSITTTYTVTATNTNGCTAASSVTVIVDKTTPTANAGANATVNCTTPSTTTTATGGGTYAWNNGATQGGTVTPTTTTTYTVTVTGTNGCTATANKVVTVDKVTPTANAGANATVNCTTPSATTTATGGGTYAWNNGATQGGTVTPTTTTTYTVTVTGTNGCTATANKIVTVDKVAPTANAGANATVNCTTPSTTTTATGGGTYAWNNGATQGGTVTPTTTTTYTVTVTGTNGCTATANKIVTVDKVAPTANAGANATVNCTTPSTTTTATGGGTYAWNNGATQGGTVIPTTTTTYTVTVTGTNGCTATANKVVTVDKVTPTANAGANATVNCTTPSTTTTATGGGTYAWNNGATQGGTVTPTTTTTYTVTVTGTNGCTATANKIVTVDKATPTANAGANATVNCTTPSTTTTATGGGTYVWNNGATQGGTVTPTVTTTYTVTVTGTNGCSATANKIVNVDKTAPTITTSANVTVTCSSPNATINVIGGNFYLWSNGATNASITVSPSVTTAYTVTVTGLNGCSAIGSITVTSQKNIPSVGAGPDATVTCSSPSATITATGGGSYNWSTGSNTASISVTPTTTTTYTVTVTAVNGCTATAMATINVNKTAPTANAGANVTVNCATPSTTTTATGGGTYGWNNGATQGGTVTPSTTTTYTVTVTGTNGCTATANKIVTVDKTAPTANAGANVTVNCTTPSTTTTATGGGTYTWNNSATQGGTVTPTVTTTYTVTVTGTNGCSSTANKVVTVDKIAPNVNAGQDVTTCANSNVPLSPIVSGSTTYIYNWSTGATASSIIVNPTTTTTYTVTVTGSNGCSASDAVVVVVGGNGGSTNAGPDVTINCINVNTTLTAIGGNTFLWSTGATTASIIVNPTTTTTYSVTTTNGGSCASSDAVVVFVDRALPLANAGPDVTINCSNQSTLLVASGGIDYFWSNGSNLASINVTPPTTTTYTVIVTGVNGCTASDAVTVYVNNNVLNPPYSEDFTTFLPSCWSKYGGGSPTVGPSTSGGGSWYPDGFLNVGSNGAAAINIYSTGRNSWLISPSLNLSNGTYIMKYKVGLTTFNGTASTTLGSDDEVQVLASNDGGLTWINLKTYNASTPISNTATVETISLPSTLNSNNVKFAFWATSGQVNDPRDNDFFIDDFSIGNQTLCSPPNNFVVNSVTDTLATISWTHSSFATLPQQYRVELRSFGAGGSGANGLLATGVGTFVAATITGMAPNTTYYCYIQADCGNNNTSIWRGPLIITTLCSSQSLPIVQDFEGSNTLTNCWKTNFVSGAVPFSIGNTTTAAGNNPNPSASQGTNRLMFPYSSNYQSRLVSPPINANGIAYLNAKFQWYESNINANANDNVQVQYSYDGINWTNIGNFYRRFGFNNGWFAKDEAIPGNVPIIYIGFLFNSYYGADAFIDDIRIESVNCIKPSNLVLSSISSNSASFSWSAPTIGGNPNAYNWEVRSSGSGGSGATGLAASGTSSTNNATATGLLVDTQYAIYVQSNCGTSTSNWQGPLSFITSCISQSLPIVQDFEGSNTLTNCWKTNFVYAAGPFFIGNTTTAAGSNPNPSASQGTNRLMFSYSGYNQTRLVSPPINASGIAYLNAKFQWYESNINFNNYEGVQVQYSYDGINWTDIGNFYKRFGFNNGWFAKDETIPGNVPIIYIGFLFNSNYGADAFIDDIRIESVNCIKPSNLVLSSISPNSASFSWSAPTIGGTPNAYNWEVRSSGSGGSGATGLVASGTSSTNNATATGLLVDTQYAIYVQTNCSSGSTSTWSGPISIKTPCTSISALPWNEGFENITTVGTTAFPSCWKKENGDWQSATATTNSYNDPRSGTKYITETYSATNEWIWSPTFQLTAGVDYTYKFWFAGDGDSGWTGDVGVNTSQNSTGATIIGAPFINSTTTSVATYQEVVRTFTPSATGDYSFGIRINATSVPWYLGFDDFSLDVSPTQTCAGLPVATAITPSNSNICHGGSIALAATGLSINPSFSYQWQSSNNSGVTWVNFDAPISGITTTATSQTALVSSTSYRLLGTCTSSSGNNSVSSNVALVNVYNIPSINPGPYTTVNCSNPSTILQATGSSGLTYTWNNGATQGGTVSPTTTTTYTVTVTDANGCTASASTMIFVDKTAPTANAGANVTINCTNPSTTMTATGGGTYSWNNGATQSGTVAPSATTTYTVTVTGTNGCTATASKVVTVDKIAPTANAGADVTITNGASTTLIATGGGSYLWSNGFNAATITVSPTSTTTYTVTVTGTNGCTASDAIIVTVQAGTSTVCGLSFSSPIVKGNKFRVNLRLTGFTPFSIGANNLRFNYPVTALANPIIVSDNFPSPDFSITNTTGSVTSSGIMSINTSYNGATNANALPIPTTGIDVVTMEFDIINSALSSNLSWRITGSQPKVAILDDDKATIITVSGINLDVPLQAVNAGPDVTVNCTNPTTTLIASGGANYLWSTGATTASINVSPTVTTTYTVTSTNGSTAIDEVIVSADKTAPIANAGADTSVGCAITSTTLTATGGISYLWNNGATTASINVSPTITTTYSVTVAGANGCKASDNVIVVFKPCSPTIIAKVFLNNLDLNTLTMDNYLSTLQDFPLTDPYSTSPLNASFIHVNNNTVASISPTLLTVTGNNAVMDWVFLELRTGISGATNVAYTKSAILQKDGDIVSTDGVSPVSFTGAPTGSYYIAVRHRSNLGFRTLNTYALSGTPTTFNFTNNSIPLNGANPMVALSPTVFIMNSGDSTPDGSIDAFDTILWEIQNGLFDLYSNNADYNLDGSVDAFDTILWELNNGKFQDLD